MFAWQLLTALNVADAHGWSRFVSMQNHYNLIYREEEREMMPLLRAQGMASTPYSPLAAGRLTRDWSDTTKRFETDTIARGKYDATESTDRRIVEEVGRIAQEHGVPRVQIALAWLLSKEPVVAPIIGATKDEHIDNAVAALEVELTPDEIVALEEPYAPHTIVGHN